MLMFMTFSWTSTNHASHSHNHLVLLLTLALLRPITASQPRDATTVRHKSLHALAESLAVYVAHPACKKRHRQFL